MSIEDPGEPGTRPATPVWPHSSAADGNEPDTIPTPVRHDTSDAYKAVDEEFEQFDWDSWQPGELSDDGPTADEVDWDASAMSPEAPETTSWREKVIGESDWVRGVTIREREPAGETGMISTQQPAPERRDESEELEPEASTLSEPLPASGGPWPPASPVSHDVVHVRVAPWAPFTTGLALALAMVLVSAAIVSQAGRLGLTLAVLTGQVPTSADAVVDAYLLAISRGDATKALSYLSTRPENPILLTNAVLSQSNEQSPLKVLTVKAGSSDINGTQRVEATYTIGDVEVSTGFTTAFTDGQWVIRDDPGRIGVGSLRASGIPLFINGQSVPDTVDSLPAFPGTYELSTQSSLIDYASPSTLVVRSSDEAPIIGAVKLELTSAGRQAALDAVRAAVSNCLAKKELQPSGCPQNIESDPNEPELPDTIVYSVNSESMTISDEELRLSTVTVTYVAQWHLDVKVNVNGTPRDVPFTFDFTALWQVTMSGARPIAVLMS